MCIDIFYNLSVSVRHLVTITKWKDKTFLCLDRWTAKLLIFTRNLKIILCFRVKIYIVSVHVSI